MEELHTTPRSDLGLIVVIPCYNEPDLLCVLDCLWDCARPAGSVEVIVVVNASRADTPAVHAQNRQTVALAEDWIAGHMDNRLGFYVRHFPELPPRHAGVGLARRLGMEEAVARFAAVGNLDGIIACLDADCCCDRNYLTALAGHFHAHPESPGCSVYFEHPLAPATSQPSETRAAIMGYELHLRYYVHGLRYAGSPYAFYTVGSCMAVRAGIYEKQGGMNRRKAGEDFYFLQKIIGLGNFTELRDTRVLPSPRISGRTPFGTGRAMQDSLDRGEDTFYTYAPEIFRDLGGLISGIGDCYGEGKTDIRYAVDCAMALITGLPGYVLEFLNTRGFDERYAEILRNAASPRTFRKRFHRWFNGLLTLQFIHFATQHRYPKVPVEQAAHRLLEWSASGSGDLQVLPGRESLLLQYRAMDRDPQRL
uniref:Glycosyl transferase family 2 n=1 Tax=Candidatus Kentrum sp. FW TaxID=2126338 RepID=A0A450SDY6_9GAMM|nr:MAG: Glycosyl transferase family 2 [Candidatus Kentron sp. FW]